MNDQAVGRHYATGEPVRISCENGLIRRIEPADASDAGQNWLAPTIFDLQVNGYGGIDFQQEAPLTLNQLLAASRSLREAGCARFLLTLITDDWAKLTSRLRHIRALRSQSPELRQAIVGWHIEGPFLSSEPGFHGAHPQALMRDPTPESMLELRTITGADPCLLTLAPERPGSIEAIRLATSRGLKISLGHSNAAAEVLAKAVQNGATAFTHLGNGCPRDLDRHDNILWRVLEQPGLRVSLIPDSIHVSPPLFRFIHRLLPADSIYYTTDAMSAAGMPPGRYKLAGLELEVGPDQVVRQPGKPLFAGSALKPIDGVFRAAKMLGGSWRDAWRKFSESPAQLMGLSNQLAEGQPADFVVLNVAGNDTLLTLSVFGAH